MTALDSAFADHARREPITITRGQRAFTIQCSEAEVNHLAAFLEVLEADKVIGYLFEYGNGQAAAIQAEFFGHGRPEIFSVLEEALDFIAK